MGVIIFVDKRLITLNWSQCTNVSGLESVELDKYLGNWYQLAATKEFYNKFEKDAQCIYANYTIDPIDPQQIIVTNTLQRNGERDCVVGSAVQSTQNSGELQVKFAPFAPSAPYKIIHLKTNDEGEYETNDKGEYEIALVYSCTSFGPISFGEFLWILARTPTISEDHYNKMVSFAKKVGIDVDALELIPTPWIQSCPEPEEYECKP